LALLHVVELGKGNHQRFAYSLDSRNAAARVAAVALSRHH